MSEDNDGIEDDGTDNDEGGSDAEVPSEDPADNEDAEPGVNDDVEDEP